jgi:hypothetical protein
MVFREGPKRDEQGEPTAAVVTTEEEPVDSGK